MIRPKAGYGHRSAVLSIPLAAVLTCAQAQAETGPGAARLRQIHNQQGMDLRQEQQRYRSVHRPVTPRDYFRVEERLLGERIRQQALAARFQAHARRPPSTAERQRTDLIRYRREQAAQRLGFRLNRRP